MTRLHVVVLFAGIAFALMCLAAVTAFEIVPLETVSETSSNASIGGLNADGHPDIVLVKGRHWRLVSKVYLGGGKGHFAPGPPLPSNAIKSYSGSLADMAKSGHLDIVLSNDAPDPKLVLVNNGMGHTSRWAEPTAIRYGQHGMRQWEISTATATQISPSRIAA